MKIIVSQRGKKLDIEFNWGKGVDKYSVDRAEDFLACIDNMLKKHHNLKKDDFRNPELEFVNTGILTERIIKSIFQGLKFKM